MSLHLGHYNTATSRTHVGFQFSTHAATGGNVAPSSEIDAADIRIYRAADSAAFSATQRSSSSGVTVTSPFDSMVGFHDVDIDLGDNTDAGFYAAGYRYSVVLAPNDETIDSQTITGVVLAVFEIGPIPADAAGVRAAMGLASANLDTQLDALPTAAENATAWGASIIGNSRTRDYFLQGGANKITFASDGLSFTVYGTDDTTELYTGTSTRLATTVGGLRSIDPA